MRTRGALNPAEYADQAAEAIRALNRVTQFGGYEWASDIDAVIGHLGTTVSRMMQALSQIQRWTIAQEATGRLGHDQGADPAVAVEDLCEAILRTAARIESLENGFHDLRRISAHLTTILLDDETERSA